MAPLLRTFVPELLYPIRRNLKNSFLPRAIRLVRRVPLCLLLASGLSTAFGQTTYYVAGSGSDGNTGRSADDPFQTVGKVNTLSLRPGDQVLFRRGDTFRGSLHIRQSGSSAQPIVIDAYGSGNKPSLAGSVAVTGWSNLGNNVWQANCSSCGDRVTGLYRNNAALPLGRYPNADAANRGYLTVQSHSGKSQITSREPLTTNWTGGEAVYRPVQWILNRTKITGQNGNTLSLHVAGTYDPTDNWGYFVQNHPATLDQPGEWYYNPANKTIQLYEGNNPNEQQITATAFGEALTLSNLAHVTVRNLQITQATGTNLFINNGSNIVVSGNDIVQAGEDGVLIIGNGNQVMLENNAIEDINNNGVNIGNYQNITFRGNSVRRIALFPGRGKSGDGTYVGFMSSATANSLIENNVLDQIGYNALNFSNSSVIQRNQISNFCLTKSDGSGLYIWNGNRHSMGNIRLISNVVYNGIGAPEGAPSGAYSGANGIYLDDCTTNIEVRDNSVHNCRGLGFFLHGSSNITMTGNTAFNNGEGQLAVTSAGGCQPRGNTILNNVFVSRLPNQFNVKYESSQNDLGSFGTMDENVYARPFDDTYTIRAVYNNNIGADLSLEAWQNRYDKDRNTKGSPVIYTSGSPDEMLRYVANPTNDPIQVSLSGAYRDARNNAHSDQVTVPAFSSVMLFKENGPAAPLVLRDPDNPANAAAGLGYAYYEGEWSSLPDFNAISVVKSGVHNVPDVAVRNVDDGFALRFKGYINVPTDGAYTFFTSSDDGSKLFVGDTEVVNNDGSHPEQERSGIIGLKAGLHAITIMYYEGSGGQALSVSYGGPGISKRLIPASAFFQVGSTPPPPPTTITLRNPDNPANPTNGLEYTYHEGDWSSLPDFNAISVVKSGVHNVPDVSVRNLDDGFALRFKGYVSVPADGMYTFYTNSDDGSKLYIGNTEVVNNDGSHSEQEQSGRIGLKAGMHAITITYYEGSVDHVLTVSYSGPGKSKQLIPASAFFRVGTAPPPPPPVVVALRDPENPANAVAGLDYTYYEGNWHNLPNFNAITVIKSGVGNVPDVSVRNLDDGFGLRFKGYVNVPADGVYTFYTNSDDGSKLYIGNTEVVNNDGGHAEQERSGTIGLKAGLHAISVTYYEGGGGQALSVSYNGPGLSKQLISASAFFRVGTNTPPPPASSLRDPENPALVVAGLDYEYYEGSWGVLPAFDALIPVKTGVGSMPAVAVRNRENNFGLRYTGYVSIPANGVYTFSTNSDDGSKLYIGNTEVVNNDGGHAEQERSGTIGLKAGLHAITITYFQGGGGKSLSVSYNGLGLSKQAIPASALFRPTPQTVAGDGTGLRADYFNNKELAAPGVLTRTDAAIDFDWGNGSPAPAVSVNHFSVRWTGQVKAPVTGIYKFSTLSDDGVRLWVNGALVVDNWTGHAPTINTSGSIALVAGQRYDIRMEYFEGEIGAVAKLMWTYPGQDQQVIASSWLYPAGGNGNSRISAENVNAAEPTMSAQVFPNPVREELQVRYYAQTAGVLTLQLTSVGAYPVLRQNHPVSQGENLIRIPVADYSRGMYILTLIQEQRRTTTKVLLAD